MGEVVMEHLIPSAGVCMEELRKILKPLTQATHTWVPLPVYECCKRVFKFRMVTDLKTI
jgi:hypothetical protein